MLHVGSVRTALFAWAYAKKYDGNFVLRIEDTDKKRETAGAAEQIMKSLNWLGLEWDEGPDIGGSYGPYMQSERLSIYKDFAHKLIAKGLAYADPYSERQLEAYRQEAKVKKQPFLFRNHRPTKHITWDGSMPLRFLVPDIKRYEWFDVVRGNLSAPEEALDDFVLIKTDGYPTYNFAHVIDDHLMEISHVMRGEEFLASMPKFLSLHDALGLKWPTFATLPSVLSISGGKKLSKREGAKSLLEYKSEGILPSALLNFLASLGWNDGTNREIYSPNEIVENITLERIQKSGARFDTAKLNWMNWQHFKLLSDGDKVKYVQQYSPATLILEKFTPRDTTSYFKNAANLAITKAGDVDSFLDQLAIFTKRPDFELSSRNLAQIDKELDGDTALKYVAQAKLVLEKANFSSPEIESVLRESMNLQKAQPRQFLNLIRWRVSGRKVSPNLFDMIALIGRDETIARLSLETS
jgi:glutamyl-tRNA synthetase